MNPGPYTLFDIVEQNEETQFEICVINFDIKEPLNHTLTPNYQTLKERTIETCKEHNDEQVKLLLESKAEIEREISQGYDGSKTLTQLDYIKNALKHFRKWYKNQELEFPDSDIYIQQPERKPKYQEYEELFNRFLSDPNANPDEVKNILNDKPRWKNPSEYLRQARRKQGITVSALKAHPGFTWIDPKRTARD
jgi:hypothetical protein